MQLVSGSRIQSPFRPDTRMPLKRLPNGSVGETGKQPTNWLNSSGRRPTTCRCSSRKNHFLETRIEGQNVQCIQGNDILILTARSAYPSHTHYYSADYTGAAPQRSAPVPQPRLSATRPASHSVCTRIAGAVSCI